MCRVARHPVASACKNNSRALRLYRHLKGGAGPGDVIWPLVPPPPASRGRGDCSAAQAYTLNEA
eukprot:1362566-Alexandrium_andersonii.AAC.1